jgi:regulator of cell morphogenesis and NO signaling
METTVGQIAATDFRKALVFKKFGLDFCCKGNKPLKLACEEKGLDIKEIENELLNVEQYNSARSLPYKDWDLDFLAEYIVQTHHSYINKLMPEISAYALKVSKVHGNLHPELVEINKLVEDLFEELKNHMLKEELILFPYIIQMAEYKNNTATRPEARFGEVQNPVGMMESEHDLAGDLMLKINRLSHQYTVPEDACASYTMLYSMLAEFEQDLHLHIHLENNILFPKAIELENEINL